MTTKGTIFITLALFIDFLQATISMALMSIASLPGTVGGAALGCAIGDHLLGQIGCFIGGGTLLVFGSFLNPILAVATVPLGIVLGFAINMSLSITFGAGLITLLAFNGLSPLKRLWWGGGEAIPGLNNFPFWTAFVISTLRAHAAENKKEGIASEDLTITSGMLTQTNEIMDMREETMDMPRVRRTFERFGAEREQISQPETEEELVEMARQRPVLQDIRQTQKTTPPQPANDNIKTPQAANDNFKRERYAA